MRRERGEEVRETERGREGGRGGSKELALVLCKDSPGITVSPW